jgi:ribosome-binding protein aMBF1 (putative translation factor)|tara:strand:+ start:674 stop:1051 length:378 start_codon:yes stop_codon:yes gene_type:complete
MTCRICGKEANHFSLKSQAKGGVPNLCRECWTERKNSKAIVHANRKAQNALLGLEKQIEDLNKKIDMLENSISSVAVMESSRFIQTIDFNEIIIPIVEKTLKDSQENKFQKQILALNNRITKLEG